MCEIILNLGQQFRKRCCFKIFLSLGLANILFGSAKPSGDFCSGPYEEILSETILNLGQQLRKKVCNHLDNFGRSKKENLCGIILNLGPWFSRRILFF